jgi:hypothetical protein
MEPAYILENTRQRERLQGLVGRLSDEELGYQIENGWTVATTLAHLAFWEEQRRALLLRWQQSGASTVPVDMDSINEGVRLLANALTPRAAAQLAVTAAESVDRVLQGISSELARAIEDSGQIRVLRRSLHRQAHLDQIESALQSSTRQS